MNLFDLVAGSILVVSALIGFSRGAVLEVVTLLAFTVAAALSVYLLPFTAPIARSSVHPAWAANGVAVLAAFLIAYIGLRLLGGSLSQLIRSQRTLGSLDRTVGLAFGVVRALVVLGAAYLVFAATPLGHPPEAVTSAMLYPLAKGSGQTLAQLAPGGLDRLEGFGASLKARMGAGEPAPPDGPVEAGEEYGARPSSSDASQPASDSTGRTLQIDNGQPLHHRHHHHPPAPATE